MKKQRRIVDPLEALKQIKPLTVMDCEEVEKIAFCAKKDNPQRSFDTHITNRFMRKV